MVAWGSAYWAGLTYTRMPRTLPHSLDFGPRLVPRKMPREHFPGLSSPLTTHRVRGAAEGKRRIEFSHYVQILPLWAPPAS